MFKELAHNTSAREEIRARILTGIVTNEKGEGLSGVSVTVRGSSVGTTTDAEGRFKLTVPDEGATLEFSYIGYEMHSLKIGSQATETIKLKKTITGLNDVVVTGTGTVQQSTLTGPL